MELELKWYIRKARRRGKETQIHYILIPASVAPFLKEYKPYLDLENKTITFRK
jgi:hypothetical protein